MVRVVNNGQVGMRKCTRPGRLRSAFYARCIQRSATVLNVRMTLVDFVEATVMRENRSGG